MSVSTLSFPSVTISTINGTSSLTLPSPDNNNATSVVSSTDNPMSITHSDAPYVSQNAATSSDAIIEVLQRQMKDIQASQHAWMIAAIISIIALIIILSGGVAMLRFKASKIELALPSIQ